MNRRRPKAAVVWARLGLIVGFAASVAANVLSAPDSWVGRAIVVMYPAAGLIMFEIMLKMPVRWELVPVVRLIGSVAVLIATFTGSSVHIYHVAVEDAGQLGIVAVALVLAIDGLMVVSSTALYELNAGLGSISVPKRNRAEPVKSKTATGGPSAPVSRAVDLDLVGSEQAPASKGPAGLRQVRAKALRAEGKTNEEIAAELGVSTRTVRRDLQEVNAA